jgi:hypothetical protein
VRESTKQKEKIMDEIIKKEISLMLIKWGISTHFSDVIYDRILKNECLLKQIRNTIDCEIGEEYRKDLNN